MPDLFHPVKIAIDGNEANCHHRVGSNVYAYEIIKAIAQITKSKRRNFHLTILLAQPPVRDMPAPRNGLEYKIVSPSKFWTQFALPLYLFLNHDLYDVYFTPGHYAPRITFLPNICSIMDLAFLEYPHLFKKKDLFQLERWTNYSIKKADKIIAISKFTKNEIIKHYHKKSNDIIIAQPAFAGKILNLSATKKQKILAKFNLHSPYFLYLGTLQPRKNIIRIIDAFELFVQKYSYLSPNKKYLLVLAGKNGWLTDEINQKIEQSSVKNQIICTGFISESQKAALLSEAIASFNLGIYEGFGIPALESLIYQTIPIVANNTSLPEVVGDAGFNVNPFKTKSIIKAMFYCTRMTKNQKKKFIHLANQQIKKFSYEKSANQILTALYRLH